MHHAIRLNTNSVFKKCSVQLLLLFVLYFLIAHPIQAAEHTKNEILEIFKTYQALNADFLYAVQHGKGNSGKSYAELRKELEAYAWTPLKPALASAQKQVCQSSDLQIIQTLFQLKLATQNSADEAPDTTLGEMFVCQPDAVEKAFKSLPISDQQKLFPDFQFGFENAINEKPADDPQLKILRQKIKKLGQS